jgi:hypothetical protein
MRGAYSTGVPEGSEVSLEPLYDGSAVSRQPFPQPGEHLPDFPAQLPPRSEGDEQVPTSEPTRFIGGILSGHFPFASRVGWPLAELIVTDDEVIVRPRRRFLAFVCPGAKYSIEELSFAQVGMRGIRFHSARDPREIWFLFSDKPRIARLLTQRGIEVRDRKGREFSGSRPPS